MAGSVSVQAGGCKLALNLCSVSAVQFTLALAAPVGSVAGSGVSRLVQAVLCKLSAISNVCYAFPSGSRLVLLALFLLAVGVSSLPAVNYHLSVVSASLFTLAEAVR
jgi:hypothetical protein